MSIKLPNGDRLYTRREWGARDSRPMDDQDPDRCREAFLHHTTDGAAERVDTLAEQKAAMRGIQNFHMDVRRWSDGGYHFVVFQPQGRQKRGRAFQLRPVTAVPAAQAGHNTGTIAIAVYGNFQGDDVFKPATKDTIVALLERMNRRHPSLAVLGGHRDVVATTCPGQTLYDAIPSLARRANLRRF